VTRIRHVWIDSTVCTVSPSSLFWCLVDLDVRDDKLFGIETFRVGIGLGVLEETEQEDGGLLWPASHGGTMLFSLRRTTGTSSISPHGNSFLLLPDVFEENKSSRKLHSVDCLSGLAGVLERDTEVGTARLGGLGRICRNGSVSNHLAGNM